MPSDEANLGRIDQSDTSSIEIDRATEVRIEESDGLCKECRRSPDERLH